MRLCTLLIVPIALALGACTSPPAIGVPPVSTTDSATRVQNAVAFGCSQLVTASQVTTIINQNKNQTGKTVTTTNDILAIAALVCAGLGYGFNSAAAASAML